ncbi:Uncharacterised protein [uncultured archaeon]|nr:Uncharacterised protein [uncultured archaeon]
MNLPVGDLISRGVNLREIDIKKLIDGFYEKSFSGYLIVTLEGFDGIEEGVLIFKEGTLNAAFYEYDLYGITVFGDSAIPHIFNSLVAPYLIGDIIALSDQQVDLIAAFNEKSRLAKPVQRNDVARLIPKSYSTDLAKSMLGQYLKKEDSKKEIFKKFGLTSLGE